MLQVQALKFGYGIGKTFSYPAFSGQAGEALLITGKSGCGKTTLLHLMAGLLKPQEGSVTINGTAISQLSARQADRFRGQHIGLVLQQHHFVESLTVGENVLLASQWVAGRQGPAFARQLMERLGVARHFKRQPRSLSQGEQQRVAIARALMNSPAVLLADEPTSSLDDDHAQEVINLLKEQSQQQGCLLVVVTHDSRLKTAFANQIALH